MDTNLINATQATSAAASLERIYPFQIDREDAGNRESLAIHLQRYRFAARHLHGKHVLDIACGCGYGTALMAAKHPDKQFIGVDIDPRAVEYAQQHYTASNLCFLQGDGTCFTLAKQNNIDHSLFDCIISLETIEHVPEPQLMINNLLKQLSENGTMIASVPITPTVDGNPHHLSDFTRKSFYKLFEKSGFVPREDFEQIQPWKFSGVFSKKQSKENRSQGVGRNILKHYRKNPTALLSRIHSIIFNGLNNRYLTTCFKKQLRN